MLLGCLRREVHNLMILAETANISHKALEINHRGCSFVGQSCICTYFVRHKFNTSGEIGQQRHLADGFS